MVISEWEMVLRMGTSALLGGSIGFERERGGHRAGLRTHLLVCLASAVFMLVSTQFVFYQPYGKDDLIAVDTSRIAASVVAGVGFLGAGAIMRTGIGVQGLTTAASMWLVSAVGLAAGGGMYRAALAATLMSLFTLVVMRRLESKQWRFLLVRIAILVDGGEAERQQILHRITGMGATVSEAGYERHARRARCKLLLDVRVPDTTTLGKLIAQLEQLPSIRSLKVQKPGE